MDEKDTRHTAPFKIDTEVRQGAAHRLPLARVHPSARSPFHVGVGNRKRTDSISVKRQPGRAPSAAASDN